MGIVQIASSHRPVEGIGGHRALLGCICVIDEPDAAAGERCVPSALVVVDVTLVVRKDFIARAGLCQDRQQVAHGARGHEEGRVFAEECGGTSFECVDGRVIAGDIVPNLCRGHGLAHGLGGACNGV